MLKISCCYMSFFRKFYAESDFDWFKSYNYSLEGYLMLFGMAFFGP